MKEPLTGYPLPDDAYTDRDVHLCTLPEIMVSPGWSDPLRRAEALPVGTRWRCGDCKTVHEVVAVSLGRMWQLAGPSEKTPATVARVVAQTWHDAAMPHIRTDETSLGIAQVTDLVLRALNGEMGREILGVLPEEWPWNDERKATTDGG